MIGRTTRCTGIDTLKAKSSKIKLLNEHVDNSDRIVLGNIIPQSFGK